MTEAVRLGVIVPSVNIVVEEWYPRVVPDGVSVHFARMLIADGSSPEKIIAMDREDGMRAIGQIASCRPHAVAYGCTASSIVQGHAFDERLRGEIRHIAGAPATTATDSIFAACRALGLKRGDRDLALHRGGRRGRTPVFRRRRDRDRRQRASRYHRRLSARRARTRGDPGLGAPHLGPAIRWAGRRMPQFPLASDHRRARGENRQAGRHLDPGSAVASAAACWRRGPDPLATAGCCGSIRRAMARRGLPHSSHWGAFSVLAGEGGIEVMPHPQDTDPSALLGNIPASVSHPARIARPMVRRGWLEGGPGPDDRRGRDELRAGLVAPGARPRCGGTAARLRGARPARGLRRLLRLGQRRTLPRRAEPDPSISESCRWLCPLGRQLQLGCRDGDPAACHRPARGGGRQQCQLGRASRGERAGAGLWRHGAEEQRCRRRRHEPAHRARPAARRPRSRGRVPPDRPVARRSAGGGRGGLAPDPARHRCRADARYRPHPGQRGTARPRLPRSVLRRLGDVRGLSLGQSRCSAQGRRLGRGDLRASGKQDRGPSAACRGTSHPGYLLAIAAARRAWRAAGLDGCGAGGVARPDRTARRRFRLCPGIDLQYR